MSNVFKYILLTLPLALMQTGCFSLSGVDNLSRNTLSEEELSAQKVQCQFVSVTTLGSMLVNQLGLSEGDVEILNQNGDMYIDTYARSLGQGDPSRGLPDDSSCSALKYKVATQLMIDACTVAMNQDETFVQRLFPAGVNDYGQIYKSFLGRAPTSDETAVLDQLASQVSSSVLPAAVCGAVASSVEALNRT